MIIVKENEGYIKKHGFSFLQKNFVKIQIGTNDFHMYFKVFKIYGIFLLLNLICTQYNTLLKNKKGKKSMII